MITWVCACFTDIVISLQPKFAWTMDSFKCSKGSSAFSTPTASIFFSVWPHPFGLAASTITIALISTVAELPPHVHWHIVNIPEYEIHELRRRLTRAGPSISFISSICVTLLPQFKRESCYLCHICFAPLYTLVLIWLKCLPRSHSYP